MAHFHKLPGDERVSGQSLSVTKSTILLGLWGYLDFSKRELVVVASTSGVTAVPKKTVGNSREWLVTTAICGKVRLEARTVDGQVWDWVELTFLERGALIDQQRRGAVTEAMRHVGAHYVWGGAGATPGGQEGMPARRGSVARVADRLDPKNPCVRAASCAVAGLHVCAGRYKEAGGKVVGPTDAALVEYLKGLAGPPESWASMGGFWPRMMEGSTVTKQIVLGESCVGVRHFDCVGFINYCLSAVLKTSVQNSIQGWINDSAAVTDKSDEPGDILTVGNHHIGFATGTGRAVHASETARGVVVDFLAGATWNRRGRYLK